MVRRSVSRSGAAKEDAWTGRRRTASVLCRCPAAEARPENLKSGYMRKRCNASRWLCGHYGIVWAVVQVTRVCACLPLRLCISVEPASAFTIHRRFSFSLTHATTIAMFILSSRCFIRNCAALLGETRPQTQRDGLLV